MSLTTESSLQSVYLFFPAALGIEPGAPGMQGECCATGLSGALEFRNSILGKQLLPGLANSETAHSSP